MNSKNIGFMLIFFLLSAFLSISCSSIKNTISYNVMPSEFEIYKDNSEGFFEVVMTSGTIESIIRKEAQLTAISAIASRLESKIKVLSELTQNNIQTDSFNKSSSEFKNFSAAISELKFLSIDLHARTIGWVDQVIHEVVDANQ